MPAIPPKGTLAGRALLRSLCANSFTGRALNIATILSEQRKKTLNEGKEARACNEGNL
jgi:hypothetical protein